MTLLFYNLIGFEGQWLQVNQEGVLDGQNVKAKKVNTTPLKEDRIEQLEKPLTITISAIARVFTNRLAWRSGLQGWRHSARCFQNSATPRLLAERWIFIQEAAKTRRCLLSTICMQVVLLPGIPPIQVCLPHKVVRALKTWRWFIGPITLQGSHAWGLFARRLLQLYPGRLQQIQDLSWKEKAAKVPLLFLWKKKCMIQNLQVVRAIVVRWGSILIRLLGWITIRFGQNGELQLRR